MSSVAKGIGKVFKSVFKPIKKILPAVLGVGAILFTAGAALGLAPMAGGWGAAVSSAVGATGATGTLGSVLTGAVTQAGYGAAIGGAMSAVSGGSFTEGAGTGALLGGATGGLMGGMGMATDPLAGQWSQAGATAVPGQGAAVATPDAIAARVNQGWSAYPADGTGAGAAAVGAANAGPATVGAAGPATSGGFLSGIGDFLKTPSGGMALAGLGSGLLQGMAMKDQIEEQRRARRELQDSYSIDMAAALPGDNSGWDGDPTARPVPAEAYARGSLRKEARGPKYRYDHDQGRIVTG